MASPEIVRLAGTTPKEKVEAANFAAFIETYPNFAGRPIVAIKRGADPPDFLCLDGSEKHLGVELVQWINEQQTGASKRLFKLKESYTSIIRSTYEQPPKHIGMVFIDVKDGISLAHADAAAFRDEVYKFVADIDAAWSANPDWHDPQGYDFTDFGGYAVLARHLNGLCFFPRESFDTPLGADWLTFRMHRGSYTTDWMRDALLGNVRRKVLKYAQPPNKIKLQQQGLDEFYLLVYYDEAVLHNTPYDMLGFGFREIGALVANQLTRNSHPFDKVFLYSPLETAGKVFQAWPAP
jgi:hypothetical protein